MKLLLILLASAGFAYADGEDPVQAAFEIGIPQAAGEIGIPQAAQELGAYNAVHETGIDQALNELQPN